MSDEGFSTDQLTTPRAAGAAGLVFAVLFLAAVLVLRYRGYLSPDADPSAGLSPADVTVVLYLVPFAGIAFLWFLGVMRNQLNAAGDQFFATVFVAAGTLFVGMLFSSAAIVASTSQLTAIGPNGFAAVGALARAFFFVYGVRCAGVFTITTSTIVLRTGRIPRWVAWLGLALGLLLLLTSQAFEIVILLFPLWVALVSVMVLVSTRAGGKQVAEAPE